MAKKNQLAGGAILSYMQMGLNIIIGLIYTPIMIRTLGQNEYGLYNTIASTISMLSILSLGFNSGYIKYYAQYKKNDNQEAISKLNGLFLIVFSIIGLFGLMCGFYLTTHLNLVFSDGLTDQEYEKARILMMLLTINLGISFPMTVFSCIISSHERFIILKMVLMIKTIVSPLITLPLLLMGYKSVAMVVVSLTLSCIADAIYIYYVLFVLKERFVFRDFEKGLLLSLFNYTFFIALNIIVDQINWNIDKLLLARYKGTAMVAVYSVGAALYGYYQSFSTSVSGVFTPRIHTIIVNAKNDNQLKRDLTDLFTRVGRIQFIILALLMTGVIFFGKSFILLWAGEGYDDSYYVALLLMLPATVTLCQNTGIEIQRAQNKHKFRSILYSLTAILNLLFSIFLCQKYGAIGAAFGTFASYWISSISLMNIYYHKKCNLDIIYFWKQIFRMIKGVIPPVIFGIIYVHYVNTDRLLLFILGLILFTAIYVCSMWTFGMNEYERGLFRKPIRRLFKKNES